jgi:hypothetical protein
VSKASTEPNEGVHGQALCTNGYEAIVGRSGVVIKHHTLMRNSKVQLKFVCRAQWE